MNADLTLHIISRFIHISSIVILIGGLFYARQVLVPTLSGLPEQIRADAAANSHRRFTGPLYTLLVLIVGSGLYNFLNGPKHGHDYQVWFGIKMLLVAHIIATAILWATAPGVQSDAGPKGSRRLLSLSISGLLVIAISAYLRSLSQRGL